MIKKEIKLSKFEQQSGFDRVKTAEMLILQLPRNHDGRNTWLMNYGISDEADFIRDNDAIRFREQGYEPRELTWNKECSCLNTFPGIDHPDEEQIPSWRIFNLEEYE